MTTATAVRPLPAPLANAHVDVLIVGAGISGIGAAHYLKTKLPHKSFAIVEARDTIGGTWDLFRYPGIRSDSDLHTFAYEFKPWTSDNAIADGQEILDYLEEAVAEDDLGSHLHFGHKVLSANFSPAQARWTVAVERIATGERFQLTCGVLFSAAGYYDYAAGYTPEFEGRDTFAGTIVHPQLWPEDLDYTGKRVVVIGSGATAVTLIPAMADAAAHVTMLQRSPSYVMTLPGKDPIANGLRRVLPARTAYRITRRMNIARQRFIYELSMRHPKSVRRLIRFLTKHQLPEGYAVDTHFNPRYNPWEERMCAVRNGDMFAAIRSGRASIVTDRIARFTEHGILLESGQELRCRHHRHGDRPQPARLRRDRDDRRRRAGGPRGHAHVQELHAQWDPELCVRRRLHELVVDPEGRSRVRAPVPAALLHGGARLGHRGAGRR